MGDHQRRLAGPAISLRCVKRSILRKRWVGSEVDALAGVVSADRLLVVALTEMHPVTTIVRVAGTLISHQLDTSSGSAGGAFEVGPKAAGANGWVLP